MCILCVFIFLLVFYNMFCICHVSQGRSGADGARGMPGEPGSKVACALTHPANSALFSL